MSAQRLANEVEAVCFDCWGTLIVETEGDRVYARRIEELRTCAVGHGRAVSPAHARDALDRAWRGHYARWTGGEPSDAARIAREALATLGITDPAAAADLVARLSAAVGDREVVALPGARRGLQRLAEAGLRLALVCDTGFTNGAGVRRLLDAHGLLEWLDFQAFSDEAGASKPDPRIFHSALGALRSAPQRAVHVGDLRRTDVAGARALGMQTVRIRQFHDDATDHPEADHVVDSHDDLIALIGLAPRRRKENDR